jgi:CRP-like cAMP-binding protein
MLSKPCRYQKNSIVFKEGDEPEAVYVVIEGELTLYKRDS